MKEQLRHWFWPILRHFETDQQPTHYKESYRLILLVVGSLFLFLSAASAGSALINGELGAIIPVAVFFAVGFVAVIVGWLGSDAAVAKIWGRN